MRVRAANEHERNAVNRFADQIKEELNVKEVSLEPDQPALMQFEAKANAKTLGPKLGQAFADVQRRLTALPPHVVAEKLQAGKSIELNGDEGPIVLEPSDIIENWIAPAGFAGAVDGATQVLIDTRISQELELEGLSRDAVRHVQELRKKAKLEPEDRIVIFVDTASATLQMALETHRAYILNETLATKWAEESLGPDAHSAEAKIDSHAFRIELKRQVLK
jgi:isoleucyl-tRNA synthetase